MKPRYMTKGLHWGSIGSLAACSIGFSWLAFVEEMTVLSAALVVVFAMSLLVVLLLACAWLFSSRDQRAEIAAEFFAALREDMQWLRGKRNS